MNFANKKVWNIIGAIIIVGMVAAIMKVTNSDKNPVSSTGVFAIQSWQTKNGAKVLFVAAPQLPMVDIKVVFDAGSARDADKPGVASMTNSILNQGAGEWDTDTIAERFDSVGAVYGASPSRDMATLSLRSLTDEAIQQKAVTTFNAILNSPQFVASELERLRKNTLISLQNELQSPGSMADKVFYQTLYGDHPYASPVLGTMDSVKAIQREDLLAFYKKYYVAKNAVVAIVGALDRRAAAALAERIMGQLPEGKPAQALAEVAALTQAQEVNRHYPSTQTHILAGQPGLIRGDEDYFALYVGNHILGGSGFGSRIVKEIREKRGLAYSSYSYFIPMRRKGPFILGLQTSNQQSQQAIDLLNQTLREFIDKGPTKEELEHAKKNITGGFPLRIDSNKDIIGYLAVIGFYDLPLDYLATFNKTIESLSIEKIKDAFQRRVDSDKLVIVTVGDSDKNQLDAKQQ